MASKTYPVTKRELGFKAKTGKNNNISVKWKNEYGQTSIDIIYTYKKSVAAFDSESVEVDVTDNINITYDSTLKDEEVIVEICEYMGKYSEELVFLG